LSLVIINYTVLHYIITTIEFERVSELAFGTAEEFFSSFDYFECPFVPLTPCLGIYFNFLLAFSDFSATTWTYFGWFQFIGVVFYFVYGIRHSKLK
jgi:APA family basic amino acid/polyamine antiporter